MTLLRAFGPRLARKRKSPTVQVFQGHWRGSNLQRKVSSNFATDFNIKTASAATAAEARGDGRPTLCGFLAAAAAWGCLTGRTAGRALTPQVLQRTPPGLSYGDTASVVVVALGLFREELRKHHCSPLRSPTERRHASASACRTPALLNCRCAVFERSYARTSAS